MFLKSSFGILSKTPLLDRNRCNLSFLGSVCSLRVKKNDLDEEMLLAFQSDYVWAMLEIIAGIFNQFSLGQQHAYREERLHNHQRWTPRILSLLIGPYDCSVKHNPQNTDPPVLCSWQKTKEIWQISPLTRRQSRDGGERAFFTERPTGSKWGFRRSPLMDSRAATSAVITVDLYSNHSSVAWGRDSFYVVLFHFTANKYCQGGWLVLCRRPLHYRGSGVFIWVHLLNSTQSNR